MKSVKDNYKFLKEYKLGKFLKPNYVNISVTLLLIIAFVIKNREVPFDAPFIILILIIVVGVYLVVSVVYDILKQYYKKK